MMKKSRRNEVVKPMNDKDMKSEYGAEQIRVLRDIEAVRLRPAMYIGSTDGRGLHHLVYDPKYRPVSAHR